MQTLPANTISLNRMTLVVNTSTPFVAWIYGVTAPLAAPFSKILPDWKIAGFVVDFATVAAIIVFALAGSLLLMLFPCPRTVVVTEGVSTNV
jgi:uncharacterized protein YggT (Ycf19 family)